MQPPSLQDVIAARPRVYAHMQRSPLLRHPLLDAWIGGPVWIKHENHNPTGAFKVRGGFNLVAQLSDHERRAGVIAASTGNHGQSLALACRTFGVACRIVVPVGNNPEKNAAMRAFGAEVVEHGRDFDEAREFVEAAAAREGRRYVHSANEPQLIAGVATCALEIFEELPDVDRIFVPIGGGSGACGCGLVRTAIGSRAEIVGVQATRADAFTRSWRGAERVSLDRAETFAEGIATRTTYDLTFAILRRELNDVVTLEEDELREAVVAAIRFTHNLAEGAGAAALGAARRKGIAEGEKVVCVMTGGNADARTLRSVFS
ncbi:MAG TPA: threonine dehydratase [Vicinamibacterales bacterium]|nr:threonine dehydratase [Vicinamibacterales bacterium]